MPELLVTLLLPGYTFAGTSDRADTSGSQSGVVETSSVAELRWLDEQVQMPWQAQLCHLLGIKVQNGESLPMAQFIAPESESDKSVVCVAPIHLKADRDTASVIPPQQLGLSENESVELLACLNDFLQQDGIKLFAVTASDWYMSGLDGQALKSFPPSFLAHRNASAYMPGGVDSGKWRRLMTEIQMLLHTHPVNILRESEGKLPVNSVWFWGGAQLPEQASTSGSAAKNVVPIVYTDDPYAKSLCSHTGTAVRSLKDFDGLLAGHVGKRENQVDTDTDAATVLIDTSVIDAWLKGEQSAAIEARNAIDERWIRPLVEQIAHGHCREFEILTEDGQYATCNASILNDHARQVAAALPSWWNRVLARFQR